MSSILGQTRLLCCLALIILATSCTHQEQALPGYIEGEYIYVASGAAGTLLKLNVKRGQPVQKGDLLYVLDPKPEEDNVEAAKALLAQLQAQLVYSSAQYERDKEIYKKNAVDRATLDKAESDYKGNVDQIEAAVSQLSQAQWALQQKTMYATVDSTVFDIFSRVGEKVALNQPVLALLAPENIRVLFYVPEKQLSQVKLGQTIIFTCDGCQNKTQATVSYISPEAEYTPPIIYSEDTRYKLVYLIRADMPKAIAQNFHPGQPVEVYLHEK